MANGNAHRVSTNFLICCSCRLKQSIRVAQNVAEQQQEQQIAVIEQQQQQQQQQQFVLASGHGILSESLIAAAEAGSRTDLMSAARKRKARVISSTVLSRDRLLPQMSLRVHSSCKSKSLRLSAGEEILLGYGRAYGAFCPRSARDQT